MRLIEIWSQLFEAPEDDKYKKLYNDPNNAEIKEIISVLYKDAVKILPKSQQRMWYLKLIEAYLNYKKDKTQDDPKVEPKESILTGLEGLDTETNYFDSIKQFYINKLHHIFGSPIYNVHNEVTNYNFLNKSVNEVKADLAAIEAKLTQRNEDNKPIEILPGDKIILELGKFDWWLLPTNSHRPEAKKMGHCGTAQNTDNYLLSLRDKKPLPKLTFEYNQPSKTLWQMKGPHNTKPDKKYHNQIVGLLLSDIVSHLTVEYTYQPESDFSIFDLEPNAMEMIQNKKPNLIVEQIKRHPFGFMNAPESIINNTEYRELAYQKLPGLKHLLDDSGFNSSLETWINAVSDSKSLILYAPNNLPNYEEILLDLVADESYSLPNHIKQNYDLMEKIVEVNPTYITQVSLKEPEKYKKLAEIAFGAGAYIEMIHKDYRTPEMYEIAVKYRGLDINKVPPEIKRTTNMYVAAVKYGDITIDQVPDDIERTGDMYEAAAMFYSQKLAMKRITYDQIPPELKSEPHFYRKLRAEFKEMLMARLITYDRIPQELRTDPVFNMDLSDGFTRKIMQQYIGIGEVPRELRTKRMYNVAVESGQLDWSEVPDEFQ